MSGRRGYTVVQTARLVAALRWVTGRLAEITGAWARQSAADAVSALKSAAPAPDVTESAAPTAEPARAPGIAESAESAESAEAAVWMAALSERLRWHCEVLEGHQPDSVLMEPHRKARPPDPAVESALNEISGLDSLSGAARAAVAQAVLIPGIIDACSQVCRHAAPHCDAALSSAAEMLAQDLDRHLKAGQSRSALSGLTGTEADAVQRAESLLRAAGGLLPPQLLRPGA